MSRRILALLLCIILIITACTKKDNTEVNQPAEVEKEYDEDKFELTALKSDKQGIDNSTSFQLVSKDNISKNYVKKNLQIVPEKEFKIEEISNTVFNIIPLNSLENDKIYQVKLNDEPYEYSWAFQTKKEFKVESTIPGNDSNYVPVHSGIEMYFSLGNLKDIDEYFEIVPEVEGRFIKNESSVIFAPEKLENNTKYTVTIKKGFGLDDGSEELKEDYVLSFKTEPDELAKIYFENPLINIAEGNVKAIGANINNQYNNEEFTINIYQYKSDDEFASDINKYAATGKFPEDVKNGSRLTNINTISQKPFVDTEFSYSSKALFELPGELKKGYYLLEFSVEGTSSYLFMQINDMMLYNAIFGEQILVYAIDSITSKGIKNAGVFLNGEKIGVTDENGALAINKKAEDYKTIFMRLEADGYNDFIYADGELFKYYYYRDMNYAAEYFRYIDTDRPVYMPTDTVNVWGFARRRHEGAVNKVRIDLVETYTGMAVDSKEADLTDIGTYETKFELKNAASGGLRIDVYDNDFQISSQYVEVRKYTKPLYTMSGELSKKVMYSGDDLTYKINADFFDGNPVPDLKVRVNTYGYGGYGFIDYSNKEEEVILSENGEKTFNINTAVSSMSWRPVTVNISSYNKEAEDMAVNLYDSFSVFPKHKMLEVDRNTDNPTTIDIMLHDLVIKDYNEDNIDLSSLRGNPLDGEVNVMITEYYYEKEKIGEHYDFINKVNQVIYDYKRVQNTVYWENINVVAGIANVQIPDFDKDRSYKIIASYYGDVNGTIEEEVNINGRFRPYNRLSYSLEKNDDKEYYRLNENVGMELLYDNAAVNDIDNDNLILLFARNGLVDYINFDSTKIQFPFKEDYISRVSIQGIYIKNGYMYPVDNYIAYDVTERQMYFDVATDKEEYKPGEEATFSIHAFDENKRPCVADINISVVDEAYFAVFEKNVNTLNDLYFGPYRYAWYPGVIKSYLSNVDPYTDGPSMAEMGGGGGNDNAFRDDFDDTTAFTSVTTDKDGKATVKFKLPDNLTSWRITYQGISDKLYVGSGKKNITVGLPFFVDLIMGEEYLKDDNINVSLRTFGISAVAGEEVEYSVSVVNKETGKKTDVNTKGVIGDYTNALLGKLDEGIYEIYVTAGSKNNKDAIKEEFSVVESYVYFNNTDYYKLTEQTVLDEVYSNPVITLFNESRSDFYNSLDLISSGGGRRIDQTVCSLIAKKYINDYFKTNIDFSEEEFRAKISEYESSVNQGYMGYKLLPYSEEDIEITVKLANLVDDEYLNTKFKVCFENTLKRTEDYNTDVSAALWGLSKYKEPVLLKIYDLLDNNESNLENRDKIYLSLALAELGDKKTANKYYKEFINGSSKSGDYLYYDNKQNDTDNYEITALLSVLGGKLKNFDTGDKLFRYIYNKPSKNTLSNFEQLIYIMNRDIMKLDEIKDLSGEVTVTADGTKKTYKLKLFDRESFAIAKDKIKDIKFSGIKGSIACKVDALGNKDDLDKNKSDEMSINISYELSGTASEQKEYNQSDLVTVTITPSIAPAVEYGSYEITYVVPSGFRYVRAGIEDYMAYVDGQKLTFYYHYDKDQPVRPIEFYMQAAQKGEYTVDYAVIKESLEAKLNYVDKTSLTIN